MKTTDELIKVLENSDNLETYLENNKDNFSNISFTEYLNVLMKKYNLTKSQIINNSNIQKNSAYQIFDGSKKPSRDKVLCLCFAIGLHMKEANTLLTLAGHSILYPRIKRDSIIRFGLEKKASLIDINITLHEMDEAILE